MKKCTFEWARKADDDRALAQRGARGKEPLHDGVCFHCQQCAEKYLKGLIEELDLEVPKTHKLEELLDMLLPFHSTLRPLRRGLRFLTGFAVVTRYPGEDATRRQAKAALRWMERVRTEARKLLGIRGRLKKR